MGLLATLIPLESLASEAQNKNTHLLIQANCPQRGITSWHESFLGAEGAFSPKAGTMVRVVTSRDLIASGAPVLALQRLACSVS